MMRLLSNPWMAAPVGVVVYFLVTVMLWQTPKPAAVAASSGPVANTIGPSWDFSNPEADQLVAELKSQKQALDTREQQLNELAARLAAESAELGQVTQTVHLLQTDFDKSVSRVASDEQDNIKKLAKVYAEMAPDSTAAIFQQMDDAAVVKIMAFMKDAATATILEAMSKGGTNAARHAAELSDRLRVASIHAK